MNVLAFDCAGAGCSAAVLIEGRVAARETRAMERGQAETLLPMLEGALAAAALRADELDLIAVTTGPGSFTGVRIGLAAARGLALASGRPAAGLSSFAAVAAGVPPDGEARPLVVALDSRRGDFFVQCFSPAGAALGPGRALSPELAVAALPPGNLRLAGDAAARLAPLTGGRGECVGALVDPAALARAAEAAWSTGTALPLVPIYLRPPDTTPPPPRRAREDAL